VLQGVFGAGKRRGNAAKTSFRKIKKDENRKKNWKMLKSAK